MDQSRRTRYARPQRWGRWALPPTVVARARWTHDDGVVGIGSEVLRPVLGGAYAAYGLLLFVWLAWVAVALWRLAPVPEARTAH
ncbi:hypothetical protein NOCA150187 [metagenome]|uniref:Uncharacterized protein n=1 Tax=metagenome TaxID=256318 RepID=A0A2P2CIW2_9ZZZZ